jgi:hypothetical protein
MLQFDTTAPTAVGVATAAFDPAAARRHFVRAHTTIELRVGFEDADPQLSHYVNACGAARHRAYTLLIATSPTARLIVLADRTGRALAGGLLLEDRASGHQHAPTRATVNAVLAYLGQMHRTLHAVSA